MAPRRIQVSPLAGLLILLGLLAVSACNGANPLSDSEIRCNENPNACF